MVYVCRDPKGKAALDHSSSHKTPTSTAITIKYVSKADAVDTNEVTALKHRVSELETKLAKVCYCIISSSMFYYACFCSTDCSCRWRF